MLPLGPPDDVGSPYASSSAFAAWSGFLAEPARACHARELDAFRQANATGSTTGSAPAAASPTRSASSASGRRCASTPRERGVGLIGDVPIYSRRRQRRPAGAPGALPRRARRRRSPGPVRARSASTGAIRSSTGTPSRGRLPLVDRAASADARALRPHPDRPLPRLRRLLGDPGGRDGRPHAATGCRARGRPSSGRPRPSSARCP